VIEVINSCPPFDGVRAEFEADDRPTCESVRDGFDRPRDGSDLRPHWLPPTSRRLACPVRQRRQGRAGHPRRRRAPRSRHRGRRLGMAYGT